MITQPRGNMRPDSKNTSRLPVISVMHAPIVTKMPKTSCMLHSCFATLAKLSQEKNTLANSTFNFCHGLALHTKAHRIAYYTQDRTFRSTLMCMSLILWIMTINCSCSVRMSS